MLSWNSAHIPLPGFDYRANARVIFFYTGLEIFALVKNM